MFPLNTVRTGLLIAVVSLVGIAHAQEARKVKSDVKPAFPEMARKMNLSSTVKVQVEISPAGTVTSAKALGGHPMFLEAATDAAKKWRFEPSTESTTQVIEFKFINPSSAQ